MVNGNINVFFKKGKYGNFSREGLNYVSGLLFHSGSLCAFTNPSTNSYKRLVEGFEAPVEATFAQSTKNGAIRIPATVKEKETRMVYRVGDASCNPYLSLSSMLMAGIDGIKKNLDPEKFYFGPFDDGITGSRTFKKKIKSLPRSMTEALVSLEKDNEYLKTGDVFDDGLITQWIKMKKKEVDNIFDIPHPKEFVDYFTF